MCKFCDTPTIIEQNYPDEGLNHYDSASYFIYGRNYLHISSQYVSTFEQNGDKELCRRYPIFNIKLKFCPMCGKQLDFGDLDIDDDLEDL